MAPVRRVVLDVLKPHEPSIVEFAQRVTATDGVAGVTASLVELDREVQNVKLTCEGEDLDFAALEARIEGLGGTVHSVDEVACGEVVVEDRPTFQDR